jgi:hypothetical protein
MGLLAGERLVRGFLEADFNGKKWLRAESPEEQ